MKGSNRRFMLALAALCLAVLGCTGSSIDDADSAPVQLEVQTLDNPPVEVTLDPVAGCVFEVTEWSALAGNLPKNSLATTSPFNDIELLDVTITYTCDPTPSPCPGVTSPRVIPLTGTVPADGSQTFTYLPIFTDDINLALLNRTLVLDMTFRGVTVAGDGVDAVITGETLVVEGCF